MQKIKKILFSGIIIFVFLAVTVPGTDCESLPKLKITSGEYAPFVSSKIDGYGLITEIITASLKDMGYAPEYVFYPWKRCELAVKNGELWAAFPYAYTEERAKFSLYSDRIMNSDTKFFYSKKHLKKKVVWETLEDLKQYKIGGVLGYFYRKDFDESGLKVIYAASEASAVNRLRLGSVDLYVSDEAVFWHLVQQNHSSEKMDFAVLDKSYSKIGYHLMVSKKYPGAQELLTKFNVCLKQVRQSGLFNRILKKYHMPDTKDQAQ
ncbi:MAG: amino acid ABC transporter substrate-binding protein [Desulfobacteraceae bacterium]|nr:amino acid ABC transporter substrate-binding protein [Desulfobacteraceae bacterium]